jgi:arabinogalactan oligomer/maltooligosaccharide transport system substrate-binding protein
MVAEAKKHTNAAKGKFGLVYENANFYYQAAWMQGFGGRVFNKRGKPTLDSQPVVDSMAFAQELANDSGVMPAEVTSTLVTTLFNQGKAAMVINGPWFLGEIDKKVKYKVALLPVITKSGKRAAPFLSAEGVMMSAKTSDKKAAFKVMEYLTSPEAGKIMATVGRQPTACAAVYDDPAVKKDAVLTAFREQLKHSVPMPNTPAMRMVWSPATTAMNKVISGKEDPKKTMTKAQSEVKELVKGARR